jgi:hypothetical protein
MEDKLSTSFPADLDELNNPAATQSLAGHAELHSNVNDAIEAIQLKIGVDGSEDSSSLDYKITQVEAQLSNLGDQNDTTLQLLGLDGNNDLTIEGIENPTVVDTFAKNTWRTVKYQIQVTYGSEVYTSTITALQDGQDIMVSESDMISNTDNNLFSYIFEENSGIIGLKVTPAVTPIGVRYYRTAVKI